MNEIWRVLSPSVRFYALTPCYPSAAAFQDPTHIITAKTHDYFRGDLSGGAIYGFNVSFRELRTGWVVPKDSELAQPYDFLRSYAG